MRKSKPTRPRKRAIARVLLWLVVGVVVNTVVAWGIVLTSRTRYDSEPQTAVLGGHWNGDWPSDWRAVERLEQAHGFGTLLEGRAERNEYIPGLDEFGHRWQTAWSFGVPLLAIGYLERTHGLLPSGYQPIPVPRLLDRGLGGTEGFTNLRGETRHLPIRPLWPGFALNTLFYAALAWTLWQVPLAIRRRRRRARGQCVRCGYALTGLPPGSPCPECGPASLRS